MYISIIILYDKYDDYTVGHLECGITGHFMKEVLFFRGEKNNHVFFVSLTYSVCLLAMKFENVLCT